MVFRNIGAKWGKNVGGRVRWVEGQSRESHVKPRHQDMWTPSSLSLVKNTSYCREPDEWRMQRVKMELSVISFIFKAISLWGCDTPTQSRRASQKMSSFYLGTTGFCVAWFPMSQRKKGEKKNLPSGNNGQHFFLFPLWHWNAWIWLKQRGAGSSILKLSGFVYLVGRWPWKVTRVWSFVYQIYIEWLECARDWLRCRASSVSKSTKPLPLGPGETDNKQTCLLCWRKVLWREIEPVRRTVWRVRWWLVETGRPGVALLVRGHWSGDPERCRCGRKCPRREGRKCKGLKWEEALHIPGSARGAECKRECWRWG